MSEAASKAWSDETVVQGRDGTPKSGLARLSQRHSVENCPEELATDQGPILPTDSNISLDLSKNSDVDSSLFRMAPRSSSHHANAEFEIVFPTGTVAATLRGRSFKDRISQRNKTENPSTNMTDKLTYNKPRLSAIYVPDHHDPMPEIGYFNEYGNTDLSPSSERPMESLQPPNQPQTTQTEASAIGTTVTGQEHMPLTGCTSDYTSLKHVDSLFEDELKEPWDRKEDGFQTPGRWCVLCHSTVLESDRGYHLTW